jgi:hypothetical protein
MAGVTNYRRSQDHRRSQDIPQQTPPVRSSVAHEPMPQQLMPGPPPTQHAPPPGPPPNHLPQFSPPLNQSQGPPPNHLPQFTQPPPPSGPPDSSVGGVSNYGGSGSSNEMSQMPPSFSPESSAPQQKQGGFRKLIKRRPVSGGHP